MLQKLKNISPVVLLCFFGTWVLQSVSPLLLLQHDAHHDRKVMVCSMDGDCNSSCSLDGKKSCSCNHTASYDASNNAMLCGCNHHGDSPMGINAPFQIKALLVSALERIPFSPKSLHPASEQSLRFIFTDDIFHPPRLNA